MDGILNINKPAGMTSHDVIIQVRKVFHLRKVGHAGTLDPDATGVLVVCLGKATKSVRFLVDNDKEYEAMMILGISTDSQDAGGQVLRKIDKLKVSETDVREAMKKFRGEMEQIPPMVSAIHYRGKRLYQLARQGKTVKRAPRKINIFSLKILEIELPRVKFSVVCSKGTYIRTLCADIGDALGCGAHQAELIRIRSGAFHIRDSLTLEKLKKAAHPESFLLSGKLVSDKSKI